MIDYLFGYPIGKYKINPHSYDKKNLIKNIYTNYHINPYRNKWTNPNVKRINLHMMYNDDENKEFIKINFKDILPLYDKTIREYLNGLNFNKNISYKYDVVNYTAGMQDQAMEIHDHIPNCNFSSVHYIQFNKDHSQTLFHNPHPYAQVAQYLKPDITSCVDKSDFKNSFLFQNWSYEAVEDDFIIFPAELKHEVPKIKPTKVPRMTVVVNVTLNTEST